MAENKKTEADFTDLVDMQTASRSQQSEEEPKAKHKKLRDENFVPLVAEPLEEHVEGEGFDITVNRKGDHIESIDIVCECGKKSRLVFEFQETS